MLFYCQQTQKKYKGMKRSQFTSLSAEQKKILSTLLKSRDQTIRLDRNAEDTQYLLKNMLIHQPQQAFYMNCSQDSTVLYAPEAWLVELYASEPQLFR